jgi:hypothetical protein
MLYHQHKYYRHGKKKKKIQVCKTTKYEGLISLALCHYLEDALGGGRWSNSIIRLTQIRDSGPTR